MVDKKREVNIYHIYSPNALAISGDGKINKGRMTFSKDEAIKAEDVFTTYETFTVDLNTLDAEILNEILNKDL